MRSFIQSLLPFLVGGLLCFAALGKVRVLLDPASITMASKWMTWGTAALVMGEIALAWWVVSGWKSRQALRVSQWILFLFALVSGFKWLSGETDCGCFGPEIKIHPFYMAIFDLTLVAILEVHIRLNVSWNPFKEETHPSQGSPHLDRLSDDRRRPTRFLPVAVVLLSALGLLLSIGRRNVQPFRVVRMNEIDWNQETGKPGSFYIQLRADPGQPLSTTWISPSDRKIFLGPEVTCLMVSINCDHCRTLVKKLADNPFLSNKSLIIVSFNYFTGYLSEEVEREFEGHLKKIEMLNPGVLRWNASPVIHIHAAAPALLKLNHGIVESVQTDPNDIESSLMKEFVP